MNSSNVIDISKSSLIGLKAELLKKQEEVKKLKELKQLGITPAPKQKKISGFQKSNEGVEKRSLKDVEPKEEDDTEMLQKSREVLEAKSRLYDKLKENKGGGGTTSQYLIDFGLKEEIYHEGENENNKESGQKSEDEEEDAYCSDSNSDPENDWVDYVDTLGRSRRCLRKDLPELKAKDAKLAKSLRPPTPPPVPEVSAELLSWDMQREMMRKKWEEQETALLGKKDIHYQDVRFDEARAHGVGYFEFSMDEDQRLQQQQSLKNLRNETLEQQQAAQGLRLRRQQQLAARMAAARKRQRERLGLPPEEEKEQPKLTSETNFPVLEEKKKTEEQVEDLEESIKKIAPVRPWDIGKDGVPAVMSQEEWVEKKRLERPEEFAPPSSLLDTNTDYNKLRQKKKGKQKASIFKDNKSKPSCSVSSANILVDSNSEAEGLIGPTFDERKSHPSQSENRSVQDKTEEENCIGPSFDDWKSHPSQSENSSTQNKIEEESSIGPKFDEYKSQLSTSGTSKETFCQRTMQREMDEKCYGPSVNDYKSTSQQIDDLLTTARKKAENVMNHMEQQHQIPAKHNINIHHDKSSDTFKTIQSKQRFVKYSGEKAEKYQQMMNEPIVELNPETNTQNYNEGVKNNDINNSIESPTFSKQNFRKRKGAEIPPPPSMSYYNDSIVHNKPKSDKVNLSESIAVGLNYLKSQTVEKDSKRIKGLLDLI